jgi:hypothetical protein
MCEYYKLNFEVDGDNLSIMNGMFWSPDSKEIFIMDNESSLHTLNITSGQIELFIAPDPNSENAYYTLSSTGQELYYLTKLDSEDSSGKKEEIELKYLNLTNGSKGTAFNLQLQELGDEIGIFSIAPTGKVVVLRSIIKEDHGLERSALIFLGIDGKIQKIVKTDRWLLKPLYSESNLTFEEKLIGKWHGEEGQTTITKGLQPRTYRFTLPTEDKVYHASANLINLKGTILLGMFYDESLLENKDGTNSHLLPDIFMRIVQIEPKLVMQFIEYDELAEILKKTDVFIRPEDFGTEDIAEFQRVDSLQESSGVFNNGT